METLKAFYALLSGQSKIFDNAVWSIFAGRSGWYLLVPVVVLFMFLLSGVFITVILARQRYKEGVDAVDRKIKRKC